MHTNLLLAAAAQLQEDILTKTCGCGRWSIGQSLGSAVLFPFLKNPLMRMAKCKNGKGIYEHWFWQICICMIYVKLHMVELGDL